MRQYLGFIFYFICIAQILMFVSVDIKAQEQKRIVYSDVLKTLEEHTCLECHSTNKKEGNVDLSNYQGIVKVLKPGHANQSLLVHAVEINMMPALRDSDSNLPLFSEDLTFIEDWINSGAPIKQFKKIRKIFKDYACIDCHRPPSALAGVNLTTYEEVMKYVVPMDLDGSILLSSVKIKSMPLYENSPGLRSEELALINEWINSGVPKD
ncbi:MAG: hypothetical protein HOI47_11210 [Candidatus Scalindua sp.]|jgi:hypothetical protein|nr:hypothetical protein [Candidatus Scalindua sp.]